MAAPQEVIIIDSLEVSVMSELESIIHWNESKEQHWSLFSTENMFLLFSQLIQLSLIY